MVFIRFLLIVIALDMSLPLAVALPEEQKMHGPYLAIHGVVCDRKADIEKIRRTVNSLRYWGQLRDLTSEWRCQIYARRTKWSAQDNCDPRELT